MKKQPLEAEVLLCVCESCPNLCNPMDCSPPGSSVHGIFQARMLELLPFPSPEDPPDLGIESTSLVSPVLADNSLPLCHLGSLERAREREREREGYAKGCDEAVSVLRK